MSEKRFPIEIGGTTYPVAAQTPDNSRWVSALAIAHGKEITFCKCEPGAPVRLSVKHYGASTAKSHYGLARWRETGLDHHHDCVFFSEELSCAAGTDTLPAFEDMEDGVIRAHLARPLGISAAKTVATPNPPPGTKPSQSRSRASDIALLLKLWRHAGLNAYRGKEANWFMASLRLLHAAKKVIINRAGDHLADVILLGTHSENKSAMTHNTTVLASAAKKKTRLFVIGRLRAPSAAQTAKASFMLPLLDFDGLPKTTIDRTILDKFLVGRDHMKNVLASRGGNVIVVACIEPSGNDWWRCVDIAGFVATKAMIPIESSYEGTMADHLIDEGRQFVKPLHVDDAGSGDRRPDFILFDTTPRTMIEVWGMATPEYLASKAQRLAHYKARNTPVVSWNAFNKEALPILPAVTSRF